MSRGSKNSVLKTIAMRPIPNDVIMDPQRQRESVCVRCWYHLCERHTHTHTHTHTDTQIHRYRKREKVCEFCVRNEH